MGDRLLEGRAPQSLVARSSPPFDGEIVVAGLGEVTRDRLGLGRRAIAQKLSGAAMQRLAPAFEQVFVGRVLDQRVLETVFGLGRQALDQENVGLGELFQRLLQRRLVHFRDCAQEGKGKAAPKHGADHRDLARRTEPIEPRGQGLLQGRRDRLRAALFGAFEQEPRDLLDEQRHAAGTLADAIDHLARQGATLGDLADHLPNLRAIEGRKRHRAVMRARAPRRAEFRPRGRDNQERRKRAAFRKAPQRLERGRIGPVQILDRQHDRLRARPRQEPGRNRRQLPAAQFLRRERQRPLGRERNVDERRQQRNIFRRVELDLRERRFEVGERRSAGASAPPNRCRPQSAIG